MIGYYAHHLGQGHVETARCIAARLTDEVTVLSSLPRPPGWPSGWVTLPRDDGEAGELEPPQTASCTGHRWDTAACVTGWP